jgi:hypothetical protein
MSDDLDKRGPADRRRINIHEPWEVRWWTRELHCTEAELIKAVSAVGVMADDVRRHLRK